MTTLIESQRKTYGPRPLPSWGKDATIKATVRHDDECGNGHNSFAITAEVRVRGSDVGGGCMHDEIAEIFPELAPFIKWHLVDTSQPLHYIANTLYWLGYSGWCDGKENSPPNIKHARTCAVWAAMPEDLICPENVRTVKSMRERLASGVTKRLEDRRAQLMADFRAAVESLGFTY
jgi:hypothetical protein